MSGPLLCDLRYIITHNPHNQHGERYGTIPTQQIRYLKQKVCVLII